MINITTAADARRIAYEKNHGGPMPGLQEKTILEKILDAVFDAASRGRYCTVLEGPYKKEWSWMGEFCLEVAMAALGFPDFKAQPLDGNWVRFYVCWAQSEEELG